MKRCFKCGEVKQIDDFYEHPAMKDGHLNKCKECTKKDNRQNRRANLEYYRAYDRKRSVLPHRAELRKKVNTQWQRDGRRLQLTRRYREKYPERYAAHTAVNNALRSGKLIRPSRCEGCGKESRYIDAHHHDYDKPLDVMWLCLNCHAKIHRKYERD